MVVSLARADLLALAASEHGRQRNKCKECRSEASCVVVEATMLGESDDEEESIECVEATLAGPDTGGSQSGGKRKR